MDQRYNTDFITFEDWDFLTTAERIGRCRLLADEARQLSDAAPRHLKRVYLDLSRQWASLADDMERHSGLPNRQVA